MAAPWPLKLTVTASPVLPATLALGRPVAGIAVAEALPPKDTAIAAEQSQPFVLQPSDESTKAATASRVAASELTVALSEGAAGLSGAPPLATPAPDAADVLTEFDGALIAVDEAVSDPEVGTELTGAEEVPTDDVLCEELALGSEEPVVIVDDSGTELAGEAEPEELAFDGRSELALPDPVTPDRVALELGVLEPVALDDESLAPAELVSTALVTTSSNAEPATATARQPTASRTSGSFIPAPGHRARPERRSSLSVSRRTATLV